MAEAGDVGGGSRQPPLLLEHLRMHFLKEENNSPFSSGKNLSSSAGSAGPSPTSLSASGTTPLDESSAPAGSSPQVCNAVPPRTFACLALLQRSHPPRSPPYAPLMVHNSPLPTCLLKDTRLPTGPCRPLSHPTCSTSSQAGPIQSHLSCSLQPQLQGEAWALPGGQCSLMEIFDEGKEGSRPSAPSEMTVWAQSSRFSQASVITQFIFIACSLL